MISIDTSLQQFYESIIFSIFCIQISTPVVFQEHTMNTELYYYSGTGNSLHIARELQKRIPGSKLIPIISILDNDVIKTEAKTVGIVFPIYLASMPIPVYHFLDKIDTGSVQYLFAVATRIGTFHSADVTIAKILRRKGAALNAFFNLNMASNSPCGLVPKVPGFEKMVNGWIDKISPEKVTRLETVVQERIGFIIDTVRKCRKHRDEGSLLQLFIKHLASVVIRKTYSDNPIPYYTDETCTGCGICEKVCPSGKVKIVDKLPTWKKEIPCYVCFACFNCCPQQAILIKNRYTMKKGRYIHPEISVDDIARQKAC